MVLSFDSIERLAPNQASLDAARKLLTPATWPTLACDGIGLVWGEAQGSGATPYRVVISESDAGYKCTCPSRKFPCKHSLALIWMRVEGKIAFALGTRPAWVDDWLSRRRGSAAVASSLETAPQASIAAASAAAASAGPAPSAPDIKIEARSAAQRDRLKQEREASILAGLDELDLWLSDQVDRGIVSFLPQAAGACRQMAKRLVDAKAGGLASRLEALPSRLFAVPDTLRPLEAIKEFGLFHILAEAYRRQDQFDRALREDVRMMVGWTQTREALLADAGAIRTSGHWHVIALHTEVQPDRLRRTETWLYRKTEDASPRFALLLDFIPVAAGPTSASSAIGDMVPAELVFYPSPVPLRAMIALQTGPTTNVPALSAWTDRRLSLAWADYQRALALRPWLGDWPLAFCKACVRMSEEKLFLTDSDDAGLALPIDPGQTAAVLPLCGIGPTDGFGIWDGRRLRLTLAETVLGRWVDA